MQRMSLTHRETSSKHADLFLTHPSRCHGKGNDFGPLMVKPKGVDRKWVSLRIGPNYKLITCESK